MPSSHLPRRPSPIDPVSMFWDNVPKPFLRDVYKSVCRAWRLADEQVRDGFEEPERHDLFPHYRRALLEQGLRPVAKRHGFSGSPQKNARKTSNFSRIICNQVVLTASAVQQPNEIVRYAEFRLGYARSNQACFFGDPEPALPNSPLYALVLHGPGAMEIDEGGNVVESTATPGFVHVVFPAPVAHSKNLEYVGGRIDLLAEFPDVLTKQTMVPAEEVTPSAEPKLRKYSLRKEAGA